MKASSSEAIGSQFVEGDTQRGGQVAHLRGQPGQ